MFLLASILFIQGLVDASQDVRTFNENTNFENPRNWPQGHLPCANDRVIFPPQNPVITFMPSSVSFADVVLPVNGELIFPEGAEISLTGGSRKDSCVGQDVHFVANLDSWHDPQRWNISSAHATPSSSTQRNLAVPHAFRVPCSTDHVVFSKDTSFTVDLENSRVTIGTLEINGIRYGNEDFQGLLVTRVGKLLFPKNPEITISGRSCEDRSGCTCDNDKPEVLQKICSHVSCTKPPCNDPIHPNGYCCPVCGAYIQMEYRGNFEIDKLVDFYRPYLSQDDFQQVHSFTSKTHENFVQSVFIDSGEVKGAASAVARIIEEKLNQDIRTINSNRLKSAYLYESGEWDTGVPAYALYSKGVSSGGVVAIVFVVLALCGAAVAWYIYRRRHIPGFSFARFDLRASKVELELGTTPHDDLDPEDSSRVPTSATEATAPEVSKAFDNPVYDTTPAIKVDPVPGTQEEPQEDIVENPMYMAFESTGAEESSSAS